MSRFDYVKYDEIASGVQGSAKIKAQSLETCINLLMSEEAKTKALQHLEECYMWIGKAIRDDQIARTGKTELEEGRGNS
ncbi:MAG TPA: hypothetical protein VFI27_12285 [candidate division Zixibacteria bacterium]|nr:hypothetical protein [candidate division Zixibacteria bacterium]